MRARCGVRAGADATGWVQDSFYRGLTQEELANVKEYNFDHPDAMDQDAILQCLLDLKARKTVHVPIYDFKTHSRSTETQKVEPGDVIIFEGILTLAMDDVRALLNMKIFVATDDDVRLARRIKRDTCDRGRDVHGVIEQYTKFVKPMFDAYVSPSKKYADVIIPWAGGENGVAIDLIVQHIRIKLGQEDLRRIFSNLKLLPTNFQIRGMHTIIRDKMTARNDFVFYADRLIRLVVEHGLGYLPFTEIFVDTPTGHQYRGCEFSNKLCGVSIIRSGESMENALRACCKGVKIGKILIQREGDTGPCRIIYEKLPLDISTRYVLLLDPTDVEVTVGMVRRARGRGGGVAWRACACVKGTQWHLPSYAGLRAQAARPHQDGRHHALGLRGRHVRPAAQPGARARDPAGPIASRAP